jgi:hypothetical protein
VCGLSIGMLALPLCQGRSQEYPNCFTAGQTRGKRFVKPTTHRFLLLARASKNASRFFWHFVAEQYGSVFQFACSPGWPHPRQTYGYIRPWITSPGLFDAG